MTRWPALYGTLALTISLWAAGLSGAQEASSDEQRARALLGLTTQLNEALAEEARFNALSVQLQQFRAETMALTSRLKLREGVLPLSPVNTSDLRAQALARFVEGDLAQNVLAANEQLMPLDEIRVRVIKLNDAVETLRSALVMEGINPGVPVSSSDASPRSAVELPRPDGVYAEAPTDFRSFPTKEIAQRERPLVPPLSDAKLRFAFGEKDPKDSSGVFRKGVQLEARTRSLVVAPFDGKIAYAAPYLSFGNLVVIEHEGGGATLLAGLHSFAISVGDWVRQGAPLGLMAAEATPPPRLYFEFRIDQEPVDPLAYVGSWTNE